MPLVFFVSSAPFLAASSFRTFPSLLLVCHTSFFPAPFFGSRMPAFVPRFVSIPVSIAVPSCPVFLQLPIGYPPVSRGDVAIVGWQLQKRPREPFGRKISPWTIIRLSPEPMTFMETVPGALIEENIHGNTRNHVDVGSWYDNDRRRSRDPIHGRRTYADIYTDLRIAFGKHSHDQQKKSPE